MARGGPETDLALGRGGIPLPDLIAQSAPPPPQQDPSAGLGPDMGVPRLMRDDTAGGGIPTEAALKQEDVNMNPVDPATDIGKPSNPMDMGDERGGRGYRRPLQRAPWNQNYRYTQEDFYGSGNPNITFTDPRGVQLYVPQAGKLPMSIWASQMQSAQGQLAQTRKAIADLAESSKAPQTAPPYQRDLNRLVMGAQDNFIKGLASQYGGNEDLAWEETSKEGSPANREWRTMNADIEAVAQFVKYGWDDASAWAKDVMSGKMRVTPEMRQHVEELMYGVGSLKGSDATTGDFAKAAKSIRPLQRDISLVKFGTEYVLPHLPEIYSKIESEPIYEVKNGQRIVRTRTKEEADEAFYDAMVQEAKTLIHDISDEEARKYFEAIVPRVKSDLVDVKAANIPQSGESDAGAEDGVWVGAVERGVSPTRIGADEYSMGEALRGGVQRTSKQVVDRLPIGQIVSKRKENMGPRKFTDAAGKPVEMRPQYIERDANGKFYVIGRPVAPEQTENDDDLIITETMREGPKGETITEKQTERKSKKPQPDWVSVPVERNEGALDGYMGDVDWRKSFGPMQPSRKASRFETDAPKSATMTGAAGL